MRARIRFAKFDTARFVGHLDVMRGFQRLLRRSKLPVRYTEGYHPHQIMSFAQPLGLGLTSDGEYVDIEFDEDVPLDNMIDRMNEASTFGYAILDASRLSDREANKKLVTSMSLISRAAYALILKDTDNVRAAGYDRISSRMASWLGNGNVIVQKKSKKSERNIELTQYIQELKDSDQKVLFLKEDVKPVLSSELIENGTMHAPEFDNGGIFYISLMAGSETNIAPDFFLNCFFEANKELSLGFDDFRIHRMELFGGDMKGSESLCRIP